MFIGRQRELALLESALKPGASVALVGASGMGKSELARAFVADRDASWVECTGITEDELTFRIAAGQGDGTWQDALAGVEVLVLDDWSPELPFDEIRQEFEGAILLTAPVAPPEMTSLPLPPFTIPTLEELGASEALALFEDAANGVRLGAADECDATAVVEIIEHVGGHPLGIVLAGRHAASVGATEVARLMRSGTELTDEQRSPRQRSMSLALEFSWSRLGERNQTVLFLASRFDRPVRVVTLADLAGLDVNTVLQAIRELTQCGALQAGPFPQPVRLWRDTALQRFSEDRPEAAQLTAMIFDRAVASARAALETSSVGPIDDTPSIWEAALVAYDQRDRDEVGAVTSALLRWSHRFAPRRYQRSNYLGDVAKWSGNADALVLRVAFFRGRDPEGHLQAIEDARAVATDPTDRATLHFELAMAAAIRADVDAALAHLRDARECEENYAAMLLEIALQMFTGARDEAAALLASISEKEPPSPGHLVIAEYHRTWLLPGPQRLEHARSLVDTFHDAPPRIRARTLRSLADVLEREHGRHDEARLQRMETLELARSIDHARLAEDMRCELAWGAFCAGDFVVARQMLEVDRDRITAEAKLRHTAVVAMLSCLDDDPEAAEITMKAPDRQMPHVPSVLDVLGVVDAAVALQRDEPVNAAPHVDAMRAAYEAGAQSHRDQIDVFNRLRTLREQHDWSARFASHWIAGHASPFLQRLTTLDARPERVVVLADGSALRVDGDWHHVPGTSAAMLQLLATGAPVTFEQFKEAAWPGEVATWDAVVNRINVRVSKLRGLGLKPLLRKTADGFVLDGPIFVETGML